MTNTLAPQASDRNMASANAMFVQAQAICETADDLVAPANATAADCDHECDSATQQDIYLDDDTGIDAYAGVEQCGNCRQERMVVVFPDETHHCGIQDVYYSDWTAAMSLTRRNQAMADIVAQILQDAYEHARQMRVSVSAA